MLYLDKNPNNKKEWVLQQVDNNNNLKRTIVTLNCLSSSRNKFNPTKLLLEDLCKTKPGFETWFVSLLDLYIQNDRDAQIIIDNGNNILNIVESYIDSKNIDFKKFSKLEKASKTSIKFLETDIKAIAITATCLKLYSLFWFDVNIDPQGNNVGLSLPENAHRQVYEKLLSPCLKTGTTEKIFQLIRSKIYRSNLTDRYMWDLIKMCLSESPESYIMTVFKFLTQNMLISIEIDKNPIPYLVSLIDDSIKWLMRTVYVDRILYTESFGGVDEIYGSSLAKESFLMYCCNDDINKAASAAMKILEEEFELSENDFIKIRDRLDSLDSLTPVMKLFVLPMVSKVLNIPYKFLLACPPKHAMLLGVFMYHLSKDIFDSQFPVLSEFLSSCPREKDDDDKKALLNKMQSSYKIRCIEFILNDKTPIFGFSSKTLKFNILSSICGVLSASKKNLVSIINGKAMPKSTYIELEMDAIKFFTKLYSNNLDDVFSKMREKAYLYF